MNVFQICIFGLRPVRSDTAAGRRSKVVPMSVMASRFVVTNLEEPNAYPEMVNSQNLLEGLTGVYAMLPA